MQIGRSRTPNFPLLFCKPLVVDDAVIDAKSVIACKSVIVVILGTVVQLRILNGPSWGATRRDRCTNAVFHDQKRYWGLPPIGSRSRYTRFADAFGMVPREPPNNARGIGATVLLEETTILEQDHFC